MPRITEDEIAVAVMRIAAGRPDGLTTFKRAYQEIPALVKLSAGDTAGSVTRPGEQMWQQIVRNIQSHHADEGNFIERGLLEHVRHVGYKITEAGRVYLRKLGF